MLCYTTLYDTVLYYTIRYDTMLYNTILYCAMLCYAMPCHAVPCRAMPCHTVPHRAPLRSSAWLHGPPPPLRAPLRQSYTPVFGLFVCEEVVVNSSDDGGRGDVRVGVAVWRCGGVAV